MARSKVSAKSWAEAAANIRTVVEAGESAMNRTLPLIGVDGVNIIRVLVTHAPPSAPGEPPGLRFGGLRLSYDWDVSHHPAGRVLRIGSDASTRRPITGEAVDYAKILEYGSRNMAARPHLRPGIEVLKPTITPTLAAACVAAERTAASGLRGIEVG